MPTPLYIAVDQRIQLTGVKDITGAVISDGVCGYTITADADGSVLASGTLPPVVGTPGSYWNTLTSVQTAGVIEDARYTLELTFTSPEGDDDTRFLQLYGKRRGSY